MINYGLTTLMECVKNENNRTTSNDTLFALFEATNIDDRAASMVTGDDYSLEMGEDSVEKDANGQGIGYADEERLKKLLDKIPEDDSDDVSIDDEKISNVIESVLCNDFL